MPGIAIHLEPGKLLGVLLFAGSGPLVGGPGVRDCIFTAPPSDASLFDHPAGHAIQSRKNRELSAAVRDVDGALHVELDTRDGLLLTAVLRAGVGTWRLELAGGGVESGICAVFPKPAPA
jgi:hypothetical protein